MRLHIKMVAMPDKELEMIHSINRAVELAKFRNMTATIWVNPKNEEISVLSANESTATLPSGCRMHGKADPTGRFYTAQHIQEGKP